MHLLSNARVSTNVSTKVVLIQQQDPGFLQNIYLFSSPEKGVHESPLLFAGLQNKSMNMHSYTSLLTVNQTFLPTKKCIYFCFATNPFQQVEGNRETYRLNEWIKDEKTTSVPPSKGVISNFGFFSKHLLTDFVKIRSICIHIIINHVRKSTDYMKREKTKVANIFRRTKVCS